MTKREDILRQVRMGLRDVLFALAVVFLLLLILVPQLGKAREKSRRVGCESNLKQLGLAVNMYAEENQGRCPVDSEPPTLVGSWQLLGKYKYLTSAKVLLCPSDRRGSWPAESFNVLTVTNISYSYVPDLIWQPANSNSVIALDRIYAATKGSRWPSDGNHHPAPFWEVDSGGVLGGNVLFCDGRVEFHNTLPSDLKDKDGIVRVLSP